MPYSQKKNPVKMMKSALHMYKAEKKQGMHRDSAMYMNHSPMEMGHSPMEMGHSPMEMGHESPAKNASKYGIQGVDELKYMPIVDDMHRKGDSPAKAAKPDFLDLDKDGNKTEPMKQAAQGMSRKEMSKKDAKRLGREFRTAMGTATKKDKRKNKRDTKKTMRHVKKHGSGYESPANMKDKNSRKSHGEMNKKEAQNHGMVYHTAKHPKYDKKNIDKISNSPATRQGYNARLDESLAKDGKESSMKQSLKDRRDESKGMEKSMGKGAYSSDPKMS